MDLSIRETRTTNGQKNIILSIFSFLRQNKSFTVGMFILSIIVIMALFADFLAPYGYAERSGDRYEAPSQDHPFGTTLLGFDVLSRVIYGSQVALIIAFSGTILSLSLGVPLGIISGYFGGKIDRLFTLIADSIYSFPSLLLAITLAIYLSVFGVLKVVSAVAVATSVVYIPTYFRVVRSQVLQIKEEGYVKAARSMGAKRITILIRYIAPNVLASTIAIIPFNMTDAILTNAGLAFLGLGISPPTADWGYDVYDSRALVKVRAYPWLILFPGLMIFLLSFSLSLIGDALNDKFNPLISQKNAK
ncbi:MAG: ABC transporter permease [Candidatus Heimdallarchaeota archaeon]|nr:ABC transporter permease [Candidatus Heimdallarchaeota archaeon]